MAFTLLAMSKLNRSEIVLITLLELCIILTSVFTLELFAVYHKTVLKTMRPSESMQTFSVNIFQ